MWLIDWGVILCLLFKQYDNGSRQVLFVYVIIPPTHTYTHTHKTPPQVDRSNRSRRSPKLFYSRCADDYLFFLLVAAAQARMGWIRGTGNWEGRCRGTMFDVRETMYGVGKISHYEKRVWKWRQNVERLPIYERGSVFFLLFQGIETGNSLFCGKTFIQRKRSTSGQQQQNRASGMGCRRRELFMKQSRAPGNRQVVDKFP